ncbi:hypothetical protein RND71_003647 [Anisodus tanguticus]|uniref:Uncharacterized protein n=1 Tax=Anisodus tanguticus TaxID=243964 RepID=A0AAE1VUA4_9SOLA|nr:hypothetical protein RND71_003647 [Anisodus tanguticus]
MQGHFESKCRTKVRDARIKAQKDEQMKRDIDNKKENDFKTVSKRKEGSKLKFAQHFVQQNNNMNTSNQQKSSKVINNHFKYKSIHNLSTKWNNLPH